MPEKLLCPFLLAFRDPGARNPNAGCYCLGWACAAYEPMPATGETLRRDGYCGLRTKPPERIRPYPKPSPITRPQLVATTD